MANPWDTPMGPKTKEQEKTEKIRAAIKAGTFGKTPPAKKLGEISLIDSPLNQAAKLERRNRAVDKGTKFLRKAASGTE